MNSSADTVQKTSTHRNVGLLAACQAMLFTNNSTLITINGLAGLALAPYTGGTTLLTETYRPEERAKAQGANDQAIFLMMLVSSFTSGLTVTSAGWERVNLLALPLIAIVVAALVWFALHQRAQRIAAA